MSWWWTSRRVDPGVSRVEIALRRVAEGTELTIVHSELDNPDSQRSHAEGWAGAIDNLEAALRSMTRE